jgi:phage baseplate assembly protein W
MTQRQRFRAMRFVHPDFDITAGTYGLQVATSGRIDMVDADASVRQAVLLLLTTRPGERVMMPTYGCDLYQLIFAPNDATTAGLAIHYVRRALERWEPRIDILELDASQSPFDPARLDIRLGYRVRPTLNEEQLMLQLQLMGPSA